MINGRDLGTENAGQIFQHGHMGWFYIDARGIARGPFDDEAGATKAKNKPDSCFWPDCDTANQTKGNCCGHYDTVR